MALARARRANVNIWPGFVDGLATLLIVIIFLLLMFTVVQFLLSQALTGRDKALQELNTQVQELADLLALEKRSSEDLRRQVDNLSTELQASIAARETLTDQLSGAGSQISDLEAIVASLRGDVSAKDEELVSVRGLLEETKLDLEAALSSLAQRQSQLEAALQESQEQAAELETAGTEIDRLKTELAAVLETVLKREEELEALTREYAQKLADLEAQASESAALAESREADIGTLQDALAKRIADLAALRRRIAVLEAAKLASAREAEEAGEKVNELERISDEAKAQLEVLNQQIFAMRQQLAALNEALEASESLNEEQKTTIVDLGKRLNAALATKVQELARYRSEFFGRLREALGDRKDIRIVGDRFVFQSEVLFPTGSADLQPAGRQQLAQLAGTLKEIARDIPDEINWVLRIDGHTDNRPIFTAQFPSNWELSAARAISVVQFLISEGIPANRLMAAGFGEFQPLDSRQDEIAYRRNRRIEMKLTQR